jgi:ribosomal protein S18 acetylase RimI-like enzyme
VVAARLHALLMLAHAQEARLLRGEHFAPLDRTPEDVQAGHEYHLGAFDGSALLGALSLGPDDEADQIQIATLVVHPAHQRRGIGTALIREALRRGEGMVFAVSTGAGNAPALALYRTLGFAVYRHGTIGPERLELVKLRRLPGVPAREQPVAGTP